ncbi:uncharacterized protein [Brachionichthys hirsutus]|uniref:uncharacterized protein n=1 Tax=Brachionichthys hirsutus TaxID=412623 RepID=UPI0036052EE2
MPMSTLRPRLGRIPLHSPTTIRCQKLRHPAPKVPQFLLQHWSVLAVVSKEKGAKLDFEDALVLVYFLTGAFPFASARGGAVIYINRGHNATLPCFFDNANYLCWYKQIAGGQPQLISSHYKYLPESNIFHNQFKVDKRLSLNAGEDFYHLKISEVQDSDSAMYYCGRTSITVTDFYTGIFLLVKESSRRSLIQQQVPDSVRPGESITLNCTVVPGTSDGEHSVYWFKDNSRNSHLGIMYIDTQNSTQCLKSSESPAQSCVYSLPKANVSQSDSGTYYCAVASCGEILLGKGMRLDVGGRNDDRFLDPLVAALLISFMLNIILISVLSKMSRRICNSQVKHFQIEDTLDYPALNASLRNRTRQTDPTWTECVYNGVKQ